MCDNKNLMITIFFHITQRPQVFCRNLRKHSRTLKMERRQFQSEMSLAMQNIIGELFFLLNSAVSILT